MGLILGKITVETPKYQLLHTSPDPYEIRLYPPAVVAEVAQPPTTDRDSGFMLLANYIGAVGEPRNAKQEKIAMTAPVITTTTGEPRNAKPEKIAMTAPVITTTTERPTMMFVLPSKYEKAEDAPKPIDERVAVREEGERKYAAVRFSGVATEAAVAERAARLKEWVERDGYRVRGEVLLARYNPPWTLPMYRTNEILLPVE